MTSEPESLVELRVLEGPNLYFPRAAIKLTLDISGLAAASEETARRFASRIGLKNARPGAADSGFRQRFALRAVGRLVRAIATEAGTSRLGVRVRPTSDPHRIVVAYPWAHRERAQVMGRAVAEVLDALPRGDVEATVGSAAETVRAAEAGARPHTITPRVPVVAVTGTNGKTTTSRMIAHIARTGRPARRLVQHRRHLRRRRDGRGRRLLRPERRGPRPGAPRGRVRGHRDRPRRHPAQGHRPDPQRRVRGHQRQRRPPRPPRDRHPRPARRGQGRRPPDHPQGRLGRPQRRRPAGPRDAEHDRGPAVGVLPRPGITGHPGRPGRGRSGHHGHRRVGSGAEARCGRRPPGGAGRRTDDACRPVPLQRREHPGRRLGRARCGHLPRGRRGGAADVPAGRRAQPRPDELLLHRTTSPS